nr:hypothetical protein [Tanacetum cinerariifolium]
GFKFQFIPSSSSTLLLSPGIVVMPVVMREIYFYGSNNLLTIFPSSIYEDHQSICASTSSITYVGTRFARLSLDSFSCLSGSTVDSKLPFDWQDSSGDESFDFVKKVFNLQDLLIKATTEYQEAIQATEEIKSPAVGFAKTYDYKGGLTNQVNVVIKQNNTLLYLAFKQSQKLIELEEKFDRLKQKVHTIIEKEIQPADLKDSISSIAKRLDNFSISGRYQAARATRRVFGRNNHNITLESAVDPERQLELLRETRANLVPAEILYSNNRSTARHRVYQHYSEQRIQCVNDNQTNLPLCNQQSYQSLRTSGLQHIHLGIFMIRLHALHRRSAGINALVVLRDTRWEDSRQIIGTMEVDLSARTQLVYMFPDMVLSIDDFHNHVEFAIQTHGYDTWQGGKSSLLVTMAMISRLLNTSYMGFQYSVDNIVDHLTTTGIIAIPGERRSVEELEGMSWNLKPSEQTAQWRTAYPSAYSALETIADDPIKHNLTNCKSKQGNIARSAVYQELDLDDNWDIVSADFDDSSVYSISEGESDVHQNINVMVQDTPFEEAAFVIIEGFNESDDERRANFLRSIKGGIRIERDEITIYKKVTEIKTLNQTEVAKIAELEVREEEFLEINESIYFNQEGSKVFLEQFKPVIERLKHQGYIGEEPLKHWKKNGELGKLDIINPDTTMEDQPLKHVTPAMEDSFKKYVDSLLEIGAIRPSKSRHRTMAMIINSGTTIDPTTGREIKGKERMVFNYKSLNDSTYKDQYSLPGINVIIKRVGDGCMEGWGGIVKWKKSKGDPRSSERICSIEMEKLIEASNASRKLHASLIKNVDGKILGKDGKPLKSAMRKQTGPNPKFRSQPTELNINKESLAPNQVNFPVLASDGGSRVSGSTDTLNPSLQESSKDIGTQSDVNSDVFWSDNNVTNATVLGTKEQDQAVKIKEMRNSMVVAGARVTIPLEAVQAVLESGPWLIKLVPLILNVWTPNAVLKKEDIKSAPVWVKLYNVPVVAYSEVGLSLITTQIGRPIMLDSYTSSMCISSRGRKEYARALIEVSTEDELLESMIIAIPHGDGKSHSFATIDIYYEWKPPRCSTYKIFDHKNGACPKNPIVVMESIKITKPKVNFQYRKVKHGESSKTNGQKKPHIVLNLPKDNRQPAKVPTVNLSNSFNALINEEEKDESLWENKEQWINASILNESNNDEEELNYEDKGKQTMEGASTPVIHTRFWFRADKKELFCSFVYGHNKYTQRRSLWSNLYAHKVFVHNRAWCMLGDFNAALFLEDSTAGSSNVDIAMREFKECVAETEMMDVQCSGHQYTWNQKPKGGDGILKKIDRVLGNMEFNDSFVGAHVIFQPYRISDHSPAVLILPSNKQNMPFKFTNILTQHAKFTDVVSSGWALNVSGFHMFKVVKKLKGLKKSFRKLLFDQGNIHENVTRLRLEVDQAQKDLDSNPFNPIFCDQEANSVASAFVDHYVDFLGSAGNMIPLDTHFLFDPRLTDVEANHMIRDITSNEVKEAMFSMGNDKSPSLDGYTVAFFKEAWDIVGPDIVLAVREFFGNDLELINLCFADDLFLFSHGDEKSAKVIMEALDEFKLTSGLVPSLPKSTAYFCNVLKRTKQAILQIMPFEEGWLPVKYLGIPLVPLRLIYKDCKELIEKSKECVNSYGVKEKCERENRSPLANLVSTREMYRAGLTTTSKVSDIIMIADKIEWRVSGAVKSFEVSTVWMSIRPRDTLVDWADVVWFSHCIPRHAFNFWLIMRRKLKTQDNLMSWDMSSLVAVNSCLLCSSLPDSHEHLFFECTFSRQVWTHMSKMAGCTSLHLNVYDMVCSIIPSAKRRTSDSIIIKLVMAASTYFIWQERNERLFNNNKQTVAQVIEYITASIRLKLISCHFKRSNRGLALLRRLKIPELVLEQNL